MIIISKLTRYSQTCAQRPPLGPEKSVGLKEGPDKSEIKTGIDESNQPLFRGGC